MIVFRSFSKQTAPEITGTDLPSDSLSNPTKAGTASIARRLQIEITFGKLTQQVDGGKSPLNSSIFPYSFIGI